MIQNLISEAIGIIVTVFLVDRLLVWRKHREWRYAYKSFIYFAEDKSARILKAWLSWLRSLAKDGEYRPLTDAQRKYLSEAGSWTDEDCRTVLDTALGDSHVDNLLLPTIVLMKGDKEKYIRRMMPIVTQRILSRDHQAHRRFCDELARSVAGLTDLLRVYGPLIPTVSRTVHLIDDVLWLSYLSDQIRQEILDELPQQNTEAQRSFGISVGHGLDSSLALKGILHDEWWYEDWVDKSKQVIARLTRRRN